MDGIALEKLLFFDIETAPLVRHFDELPDGLKKHWIKKYANINRSGESDLSAEEAYFERSSVFAEFSKVVCCSSGMLQQKDPKGPFHAVIKSVISEDETTVLNGIKKSMDLFWDRHRDQGRLCGHNIKEFDVPFIARRMVINNFYPIPFHLQTYGKKPYQTTYLDTLELWKFGDYKSYTSLDLLSALFGIDSPKDALDGSRVATTFYDDKDLDSIKRYCQEDVRTVMQVLLHFMGKNKDISIEILDSL